MTYQKGQQVRLKLYCYDFDRVLTDSVLTLTLKDPAGVQTSPAITYDSAGTYHVDITLNQKGTWSYKVVASAGIVSVVDGVFEVRDLII